MFTIREAQIEAMGASELVELREAVVALLVRKYPELGGLSGSYVEQLCVVGFGACRAAGVDREGAMIDFVESMVKNDQHPLPPEGLARKAEAVLLDLRSRELFLKLQALKASVDPPPPDAVTADPSLPPEPTED